MPATKACRICNEVLPLSDFYLLKRKNGKSYPDSYCKPCGKRNRAKYASSRLSSHSIRRRNLKSYGMTVAEYDAMLAAQGGLCALCRKAETHVSHLTKSTRRLCVDHCHSTGKIRGLLCSQCNRAIGLLGDKLPLLRKAVEYLERQLG